MMELHEIALFVGIMAVLAACAWAWFVFPAYRCAAFAAGCFDIALPFFISTLDRTPHGHPDLRGIAFLFIAVPFFLFGVVASIVGLLRPMQHRAACIFTLFLGVAFILSSLIFIPTSLLGL